MLFKPCNKAPVPAHATRSKEKGVHYASWKNKHGKRIKAQVRIDKDGHEYCNVPVQYFYAKYKDSAGRLVIRNTECTQKDAAQSKLNSWRGITEKVKAGHLRSEAENAKEHGPVLFKDVQAEYLEALRRGWNKKSKEVRPASEKHLHFTEYVLKQFRDNQHIFRLIDFTSKAAQKHINSLQDAGLSARYRNHHRAILSGFASYCLFHEYLPDNPIARTSSSNVELDKKRTPRPLTEKEVARLLVTAETRPLESFLNGNKGPVDLDKVKPEVIQALKDTGRQHRLIYLVLYYTGLRWSELRHVCVNDIVFKDKPYIKLWATGTKGKRDDMVSLKSFVAEELRRWIKDMGRIGKARLFDMAESGIRIFDKDIEAAKIPKETVDGLACIHSLRHSICTHMVKQGTPMPITQKFMRHKDITTTSRYYTHFFLNDTYAAVESLPELPAAENEDTEDVTTG